MMMVNLGVCDDAGKETNLCGATLALDSTAQVIHNDIGTALSKEESICSSQSSSSACDDNRLAIVAELIRHSVGYRERWEV